MVKTYLKTLLQAFTKHKTRFLSVIFMVLLSVGFISGVGSTVNKIDDSLTKLYVDRKVNDFIVKKTDGDFTGEESLALETRFGKENLERGASFDVNVKIGGAEQLVRLYFYDGEQKLNLAETVETCISDAPEKNLAKAEEKDNRIKGVALGEKITLGFGDILLQLLKQSGKEQTQIKAYLNTLSDESKQTTVTVTEAIRSPLLLSHDTEPSYTNPENTPLPDTIAEVNNLIGVDNVLYLSGEVIPEALRSMFPMSEYRVAFPDRSQFNAYSANYKKLTEQETQFIESEVKNCKVLTLYDNYSFSSLHAYADKVMGICIVLMVAFLLVTALVVLSNMTRLIEEERAEIATLSTLGYSGFKIVFKYLLFAALANGIGGTGGYFVGFGVMNLLYFVFNHSFAMPPMAENFNIFFFLITFITIAAATLIATAIAGIRMVNETPATLLRPKAPKAGKKVFLERIPFLWNRLSFRYKSTLRNVLRFMVRFLMTVVSVACSMALMTAGCGLLDLCIFELKDSSIMGVAVVVAVFAGLITMVVIYTLTSINISERNRELATLKVLGYQDKEVAGYIYREVYIDSIIGILFGYPLGALFMYFVFQVIGLGALGNVSWFMWLASPLLILLFTALVTLILRRKIVRIDMNESLKSNE